MTRGVRGSLLCAFFLLFACEKPVEPHGPLRGVAVISDESRGNVWGFWDTGFYGYSEFAWTARAMGASVSVNTRRLDRLLASPGITPERTLLILGVAKFARYHPRELRALRRFARGGGRLLVIGEHDDMYGIARLQNAVLRPFGLSFRRDAAGNRSADEYAGSSRILNIKNAYNLLAASIRIHPDASAPVVLMRTGASERKVIAAETRPGRGHVIALGDSEIFWNGDGRAGIRRGQNRVFLQRLLRRFFPKQIARPPSRKKTAEPAAGTMLFFDLSAGGRGPDESLSGLGRFAEGLRAAGLNIRVGRVLPAKGDFIRVIAGPLRPFSVKRGQRLLLFAESFDQLEEFSFWDRIHLERGYRNPPSIYAHLEKRLGIFVDPCFISRGGDFQGRMDGPWKNVKLHRAGCLRIKTPGRYKVWWRAGAAYHGETLHPGMSDSETGRMASLDDNDFRRPLTAVYNRRALIFSDSDLMSNVHADEAWFRHVLGGILKWIRRGSPR